MVDEETPVTDDMTAPPARPRRSRRLDGRTIAICVCIALIAAVVAGLITSKLTADDGDSDETGKLSLSQPLLDVELTTIDGEPARLQSVVGDKPLLVNLWAQSCAPCVREMPLLEEVNQSDPRVAVVGVDVQDRLEYAKKMAKQTGITYPWFQDEAGDFAYAAEGTLLPKTLLLSTDGAVLAQRGGAFKDRADIDAWIDEALR